MVDLVTDGFHVDGEYERRTDHVDYASFVDALG
jgi:hypothetical protein